MCFLCVQGYEEKQLNISYQKRYCEKVRTVKKTCVDQDFNLPPSVCKAGVKPTYVTKTTSVEVC